ncbi:exopolysaccharide biosynthesis protein [Arenibaculum sp.]|uniref:exopolysaccharide biosynthesis protein n=1 Tax=Arenibaculum sp. TaxID=2865862 RepID=UPI002E143783|nr:exopolysaccharide biosynthesis protein [Arenibaculum sp.]
MNREAQSVADRLVGIAAAVAADRPTLGQILHALGSSGPGLTLILLSLPSFIPIPGAPTGLVFGTALALVAFQLMAGAPGLRLPEWLARRPVPRQALLSATGWLARHVGRIEERLRPRLPFLTGRATRLVLGPTILLLAILILLPIPFGNQPASLAVIALAFGQLARDGLAILLGLVLAALATAWNTAVALFGAHLASWVLHWF